MADPVWVLLMFDLPVKTKEQRRHATQYRHQLLDLGFTQVQLSVYAKYLVNAAGLRTILRPVKAVPPAGAVRILRITDEQWASTYRFCGDRPIPAEPKPSQLALFTDAENGQNTGPYPLHRAGDAGNGTP